MSNGVASRIARRRVAFFAAAVMVSIGAAGGGCQALLDFPAEGSSDGGAIDGEAIDGDASTDAGPDGDASTSPGIDAGCGDAAFESDPLHCGRCNRDCLGGECEKGQCRPFELAKNLSRAWYLIGDDDVLYVGANEKTGPTNIYRVDKKSGASTVLAPGEHQPFGMVIEGNDLLWGSFYQRGIRRTSRDGTGPASAFASIDVPVIELAWTKDAIYWTSPDTGEWGRTTRNPAVTTTATAAGSAPEGIVADATHVYVARRLSNDIVRMAVDTISPVSPVVPQTLQPRRLAIDDQYVYWVSYLKSVGRVNKQDGGLEWTDFKQDNHVGGIAVDSAFLYVVNRGSNSIYRIPLGPPLGTPEPVATLLDDPVDIHQDDAALYWTEHDAGAVWKMVK